MNICACRCGCRAGRVADCDGLCYECWQEWCTGASDHAPVADPSYLGVYGLTGIWTGWLIGQGVGEVVAQPPGFLTQREVAPNCPKCEIFGIHRRMVRRLGGWKCYFGSHEEPVFVAERIDLPRAPYGQPIGEERT